MKKCLFYYGIFLLFGLLSLSSPAVAITHPNWAISKNDTEQLKKAMSYIRKGKWQTAHNYSRKIRDPLLKDLLRWLHYRDNISGISFGAIEHFIQQHPDWPSQERLHKHAEETFTYELPAAIIIDWFKDKEPLTAKGKWHLARAKLSEVGSKEEQAKLTKLIQEAWIEGNFSESEEKEFLHQYQSFLSQKEHLKRMDRLLWDERVKATMRILRYADRNHQKLFKARIKLIRNLRGVDQAIKAVPKHLLDDPGLQYDRLRWRAKRKKHAAVQEILLALPEIVPYPKKWWSHRHLQARRLIERKDYQTAYKLISNHQLTSGKNFADAEWLSGWLALRFLNKPDVAYQHFYTLYRNVKYPVSLARGAYWAGRAAEKNGNKATSQSWYTAAAKYTTTFYGQLAHSLLPTKQKALLPKESLPSKKDRNEFKRNQLAKIGYILASIGERSYAKNFLDAALAKATTSGEITLISGLGFSIKDYPLSVSIAKNASKRGVTPTSISYPLLASFPRSEVENALIAAIIRQESLFDMKAVSPSGARGYMQLMPRTARAVAKKLKLRYSRRKLKSDPNYNVTLGSFYIDSLIKNFDDSYILGIAAYNAGQGNVRQWLKVIGDPREAESLENIIDWIEMIPFAETRNYVQRVMENTQVYRTLMSGRMELSIAELVNDFKRGVY